MAFFTNNDLAEISEMITNKKMVREKEMLNNDVGDRLFTDILYSLNDDIKKELTNKITAGLEPVVPIWNITETTFWRAPGCKFDIRNNTHVSNPELTLEDSLGSYVNETVGYSGRVYKISHILKMSDCLSLLSHYFGSNFYCYMKRQRIITNSTHHVYSVTIYLQYYPTVWPPAIHSRINKAWSDYLDRKIPCDYCRKGILNSQSFQHTYCSAECHKKDHDGTF